MGRGWPDEHGAGDGAKIEAGYWTETRHGSRFGQNFRGLWTNQQCGPKRNIISYMAYRARNKRH